MTDDETPSEPAVKISMRSVYDLVQQTRTELASLTEQIRTVATALPDHEARIRSLETDKLSVRDYREERDDFQVRLRSVENSRDSSGGARGILYGAVVFLGSGTVGAVVAHWVK